MPSQKSPHFIVHRTNTVKDLDRVKDISWGCEIDLRSDLSTPGRIHLSHDAWSKGEDFETWLKEFSRKKIAGTLILNTKEDGLENRALELMAEYKITNYFFLDTALPTLVNRTQKGEKHFAVRWSKYEPIELGAKFEFRCDWVWVDCFHLEPPHFELIENLGRGFKTCLVSPELQGGSERDFQAFLDVARRCHSICTKVPEKWLNLL